jgi:hypothetical protein
MGGKGGSSKAADGSKKGGVVQLETPDSLERELALKPVAEEGTNKAQLKPYVEKPGCPPPAKVRCRVLCCVKDQAGCYEFGPQLECGFCYMYRLDCRGDAEGDSLWCNEV